MSSAFRYSRSFFNSTYGNTSVTCDLLQYFFLERKPSRIFLDQEYPGRWIGRSGTISWPARSPDLNPLDFFYWGVLKEKVYSKPIENVADLRERISQAAEAINSRRYARLISRSFLRRCRACIEADGKQFEHLF